MTNRLTNLVSRVRDRLPSRYQVAVKLDQAVRPLAQKLTKANAIIGLQSDVNFYNSTYTLQIRLRRPNGGSFQKQRAVLAIRFGTSANNAGAIIEAQRGSCGYVSPDGTNGRSYAAGFVCGAPKGRRTFTANTDNANITPFAVPPAYVGFAA